MMSDKALVLFSGGQDSTTCLSWSQKKFDEVETVGFNYGQRNAVELECRTKVLAAMHLGGSDTVLNLPIMNELSALPRTGNCEVEALENALPSTFVPGRNILFLTTAALLAYRKGITNLVIGCAEADDSGYPDCQDDFIQSMAKTLTAGMGTTYTIHAPLMFISKAATWQLAFDLGGQELVDLIVESSHTCNQGVRETRHAWGYGCGICSSCELRQTGFEKWMSHEAA